MNEELLQADELRRRFQSRSPERSPEAGCPDAGRLWEAALDRTSGRELREMVEHTAACPSCATAWRLARELGGGEERSAHGTATQTQPFRPFGSAWSWAPLSAVAATILIAGVLLILERPEREPAEPIYRAQELAAIHSVVPDEAPLPREACVLRWSLGAESPAYSIHVMDEDLNEVASAQHLERPEFQVPTEALSRIQDGSRILWQVEALLTDGRRLRSPTFVTRVASGERP